MATLVASAGAGALSARPRPPIGHPGNPVVVAEGAFAVEGAAGSIVHIRLAAPLEIPSRTSPRVRFRSTGEYGAVTLHGDGGEGESDPTFQAAIVTRPFACPASGPEVACDNAVLTTSFPPDGFLPAGEYVLALAGPAGSRIDYTLAGPDETESITNIGHLYPVPYASSRIDPTITSGPLSQSGRGAFVTPTTGRRMLAGVVLATHLMAGGDYSFALCPGAYGRSRQNDTTGTARPTCTGYATALGTVSSGSIVNGTPLAPSEEYADVAFAAATGRFEGVTGGSFAVQCDHAPCTFSAVAHVFALDS